MLDSHHRMPQERRIGIRGYNHLAPCLHGACRASCRKHEPYSCTFADTFSHINPLVDDTGAGEGDKILNGPTD